LVVRLPLRDFPRAPCAVPVTVVVPFAFFVAVPEPLVVPPFGPVTEPFAVVDPLAFFVADPEAVVVPPRGPVAEPDACAPRAVFVTLTDPLTVLPRALVAVPDPLTVAPLRLALPVAVPPRGPVAVCCAGAMLKTRVNPAAQIAAPTRRFMVIAFRPKV
jgi:hypothetical protein